MRKIRKVCLLLILGVFILLAPSCVRLFEEHLTILEDNWTKEYFKAADQWMVQIRGSVVNDGAWDLEYAEVLGGIYDIKGAVLDREKDIIFGLRRNEIWYFDIRCWSSREPDHYEVWVGRIIR